MLTLRSLILPVVVWCSPLLAQTGSEAWEAVPGAAYYVGEAKTDDGRTVRFRSRTPDVVPKQGTVQSLTGFSEAGKPLGKSSRRGGSPTPPPAAPAAEATPEPAPKEEPAEPEKEPAPTAEPAPDAKPEPEPTPEPTPEPAAETPKAPRPVRLAAAGWIGKEKLESEGGYSAFDGDPVVGGAALGVEWLRPVGSSNRWAFGLGLEYRKFAFDSEEELEEDPTQSTEVKERLALMRYLHEARWTAVDFGAGAGLTVGTSLVVAQAPTLQIADEDRGETRLAKHTLIFPTLDLAYESPVVDAGLRFGLKGFGKDVKKVASTEFHVDARIGLGGSLSLNPALIYRNEAYDVAVDCPDVVNLEAECKDPARSTDQVTMLLLGLGKVL